MSKSLKEKRIDTLKNTSLYKNHFKDAAVLYWSGRCEYKYIFILIQIQIDKFKNKYGYGYIYGLVYKYISQLCPLEAKTRQE